MEYRAKFNLRINYILNLSLRSVAARKRNEFEHHDDMNTCDEVVRNRHNPVDDIDD